ncbi:MAG: MarR family winged helix-turn-helix transcriptional regulator [Chitinophagales bacterium]
MEQFSDFLCFRIGSLSRRIARYYNNRFADLGITLGQAFVLFGLMQKDGSSIKEIAQAVQLDSPAVTGLVDRLVKEGLVVRQENTEDRRSVEVMLTDQGRRVAKRAMKIAQDFNKVLGEGTSSEDVSRLEARLTKLENEH